MIPDAVEFSACMGVGCWGCPISSNVFLVTSTSLVLMNRPPNSASDADAMEFFRMAATTYTATLCFVGELGSQWPPWKKCPPNLLITLDPDKYNTLLWMCN